MEIYLDDKIYRFVEKTTLHSARDDSRRLLTLIETVEGNLVFRRDEVNGQVSRVLVLLASDVEKLRQNSLLPWYVRCFLPTSLFRYLKRIVQDVSSYGFSEPEKTKILECLCNYFKVPLENVIKVH